MRSVILIIIGNGILAEALCISLNANVPAKAGI